MTYNAMRLIKPTVASALDGFPSQAMLHRLRITNFLKTPYSNENSVFQGQEPKANRASDLDFDACGYDVACFVIDAENLDVV